MIFTTSDDNTAVGHEALNTGMGFSAIRDNDLANDNTALGYGALQITTGDGNTAIGSNALNSVTGGTNNIAIGLSAGSLITTGGNNITIGNTIRIGTAGTQVIDFRHSGHHNRYSRCDSSPH